MKMVKSILVSFLGLVLFSGCTATVSEKEVRSLNTPTYNVIKTSQYPQDTQGEKEFKNYHSDMADEVKAFGVEYTRLTGEEAPQFDGNMIVAKSGEKRNGGYKISIANVADAGRYTEVTILLENPGKGCMATMALTNPYVVAELPDDHKDVKFVERVITLDCK